MVEIRRTYCDQCGNKSGFTRFCPQCGKQGTDRPYTPSALRPGYCPGCSEEYSTVTSKCCSVWRTTLSKYSGQQRTSLLQLRKANSNCLIRVLLPLWGQGALSVTISHCVRESAAWRCRRSGSRN